MAVWGLETGTRITDSHGHLPEGRAPTRNLTSYSLGMRFLLLLQHITPNRVAQNNADLLSVTVEPRSLKSRCRHGAVLMEAAGRVCSLAFPDIQRSPAFHGGGPFLNLPSPAAHTVGIVGHFTNEDTEVWGDDVIKHQPPRASKGRSGLTPARGLMARLCC